MALEVWGVGDSWVWGCRRSIGCVGSVAYGYGGPVSVCDLVGVRFRELGVSGSKGSVGCRRSKVMGQESRRCKSPKVFSSRWGL